ncbi:hypothetical protein CRG98_044208 [Punica granatum]|uniref:Uncharacterized protein n=1 Tax=Punica granatum TaxID=22663 RepID=A0A2I0HUL0_PUNGR|nr:hypothetical protein CRG98_044208 [Punica granatum]
MKGQGLFAISMQGCKEMNWPGRHRMNMPRAVHWYLELACMGWCEHAWTCVRRARSLVDTRGHTERFASDHAMTLFVRKKLMLASLAWEGSLPAKVGTTRLSCGVGGRDGQPQVTTRLAVER